MASLLDTPHMDKVLATALIAGIVGRYSGREVAAFENTVICALAAGFSAYRDPREKWWHQLLLAVGYGASWGATDRLAPIVYSWVSAPAPGMTPSSDSSTITAEEELVLSPA